MPKLIIGQDNLLIFSANLIKLLKVIKIKKKIMKQYFSRKIIEANVVSNKKIKKVIDNESGHNYTNRVIQIKTCYLI